MGLFDFLGNMIGMATEGGRTAAANQQQWNMANQNYQNQKEFAQSAITWRVQDAQRAGVHPLFALGASGASYSPAQIIPGEDKTGDYLSKMGQSIDRAIASTQTKPERIESAFELERQRQVLENGRLNNEILKQRLASGQAMLNQAQIGPPMPNSPVVSPTAGISKMEPYEVQGARGDNAAIAAGPAGPTTAHHAVGGGVQNFPAKGVQGIDDIELTNPYGMDLAWRQRVMPNFFPSDHWTKPTVETMQKAFPKLNVVGVEWSYLNQSWMPITAEMAAERAARASIHRHPQVPDKPVYNRGISGRTLGSHRGY